MRMDLVPPTVIPDDIGHGPSILHRQAVICASEAAPAARSAQEIVCALAGIADGRRRTDTRAAVDLVEPPEDIEMSHERTAPVQWQGRPRAVTRYGVEALSGLYHVPFADIPNAEDGRPQWLDDLLRRHGTDRDELAAAVTVARTMRPGADAAPLKPAI
jgi:hypothetical protein